MVLFLLLHYVGLGAVIAASLVLRMWDLVSINGVVFLVLVRLERVLCRTRYTVPLPVYADGKLGVAAEQTVVEPQAAETSVMEPQAAEPVELLVGAEPLAA